MHDSRVHLWAANTDRPWPPGRAHQAQKPYAVVRGRGVCEWLGRRLPAR